MSRITVQCAGETAFVDYLQVIGSPSESVNLTAVRDGQIFENLILYGSINLRSFVNCTVRNCIIYGTLATGVLTSYIYGSGDTCRNALIANVKFVGRGNVWCTGMRGGQFRMTGCEMLNLPDGIGLTSPLGDVTIESTHIHGAKGYKEWTAAEGPPPVGNGTYPYAGSFYTHIDGIQFHRGKNYIIRNCTIGGIKYGNWGHHTGNEENIRRGDDMYNAGIMLQQEVDDTVANRIENVLIENCIMGGGMATINVGSKFGNTFPTTTFRNIRMIRSTWGSQHYVLVPMTNGVPTHAKWEGVTFLDTGAAVPFTRGS